MAADTQSSTAQSRPAASTLAEKVWADHLVKKAKTASLTFSTLTFTSCTK
jgi:hypothetical protein